MKGHYEFLQPLSRLTQAYQRFERAIWVLNAAIISIAVYALAEIIGLPGFMSFYYQDVSLLAASPAILSIIIGLAGATFIKRRKKADIFPLLGLQLSEKARTAYDNRDVDSLPMQDLAREIKANLNKIKPSDILNSRRISSRAVAIILVSGAAILLAQSEIINPSDFQSLADLRDKALSAFENEIPTQNENQEINLTGNLFGNPSLAVLNENKMEIMLYPGIGAGSLARNTEPVERVFTQSQAGDATAVPSELYIESLPPENRDIIKRYFTILSQSDR
ncbi:MAG: hypothetical protein PHS80_04060 [Methanothrix sp.]|nr:hypothetical protein [Methanothrix sp.]MDD4448707.1 hypothetical protein [Methanothrix sp.]